LVCFLFFDWHSDIHRQGRGHVSGRSPAAPTARKAHNSLPLMDLMAVGQSRRGLFGGWCTFVVGNPRPLQDAFKVGSRPFHLPRLWEELQDKPFGERASPPQART